MKLLVVNVSHDFCTILSAREQRLDFVPDIRLFGPKGLDNGRVIVLQGMPSASAFKISSCQESSKKSD